MSSAADNASPRPDPPRDYRSVLPGLRDLTPRENETLHEVMGGKKRGEIARIFGISDRTVEDHLHEIFDMVGQDHAHGTVAAVADAMITALERENAALRQRVAELGG